MKVITLDRPQCDWITVTGDVSNEFAEAFNAFSLEMEGENWEDATDKKTMQFDGYIRECGLGSIFWGTAVIKHRDMAMIQVSGELAELALRSFYQTIKMGKMKVTRLDLQVTRVQPDSWSQVKFLNRMEEKGRKVALEQTPDNSSKRMCTTVAVGSRTSEVYTRVYQKMTSGGNMLLRYEVEYKGDKARALVASMEEILVTRDLKYQLQKLCDRELESIFAPPLEGVKSFKVKPVLKEVDKKAEWLLASCLPAFKSVINRHAGDGGVAHAFLEAMKEAGYLGE